MNFKNMDLAGRPAAGNGNNNLQPPPALGRQSSIYSLTFEEFQNTLGGVGKDFGSMNMDEFLKNIWTAEETQAMASGTAAMFVEDGDSGEMGGLQRQGSLTLPRTLSQKTVDEVWRDIFRDGGAQGGSNWDPQQREPTLGEMTLEDFLVRAGVVREDVNQSVPIISSTNNNNGSNVNGNNNPFYGDLSCSNTINSNGGLALGFATNGVNGVMPPSYTPPIQLGNSIDLANQQGMRGGGVTGIIGDPSRNNGLITVAAAGSPVKSNGELSSLSPVVPYVFNGGVGRRKCNGAVEKVVERRQRRMIKNRESAARSRARKQAYTTELEAEVAKLKELNQELQKKQEENMEVQKNEVLQMMKNQQCGPKRQCLRRTHTGPW